ncbi:hypothetical protein ILYODFUR_015552 [Ilyodon furcidens]|uniref:Uncharacterized protein n=1 Tax=Ilyodon furcidens TaxID=33524 RepID=A0ABV0TIZ6_9TELE
MIVKNLHGVENFTKRRNAVVSLKSRYPGAHWELSIPKGQILEYVHFLCPKTKPMILRKLLEERLPHAEHFCASCPSSSSSLKNTPQHPSAHSSSSGGSNKVQLRRGVAPI